MLPSLPPLVTDILLSLDDKYMYVSNWLRGESGVQTGRSFKMSVNCLRCSAPVSGVAATMAGTWPAAWRTGHRCNS